MFAYEQYKQLVLGMKKGSELAWMFQKQDRMCASYVPWNGKGAN